MSNIIKRILKSSNRVDDGRIPYYVLSKCMEEMGELATEVAVSQGHGYKTAGKDGVIGEIADTIASLVDLAYLELRKENPEITIDEINEILHKTVVPKLFKWESSVQKHLAKEK
jgi:NTP pyrophosphatase (non-canonical NTP hydrolase)